MQKKNRLPDTSSSSHWEQGLKEEARKQLIKKAAIWAGIGALCIAGLAGLVMLAGKTTSVSVTPTVNPKFPKVSSADIVLGDPKAKITVTEYSDFQCPTCAAYNPIVNKLLIDYKGKVKYAYRFFPLISIHKNAQISAQAGFAANKLGKFDEMKDVLFDKQADWESISDPRDTFIGYAKDLGLNPDNFKSIMNSDEAKNAVLAGETQALGIGLNSTPTFFVGNLNVPLAGEDGLKQVIDQELKK